MTKDALRKESQLRQSQTGLGASRRYLSTWFPFLSTDRVERELAGHRRFARRDEAPLVLVDNDRGTQRISALNHAAAGVTLEIGMTLADARARVPNLKTMQANPKADRELLLAGAAACEIFTPLVAIDGRDGLVLDITGCAHLFGGEAGLNAQVRRRLGRLGLGTRATVAGTPEAARAFARFARTDVVLPEDEENLARTLPIAALDRGAEASVALARAGLKTLGDLAVRPSKIIAARFGPDLVASLDRILGREDIRISPLRAVPDCMAERHFPEPISAMASLEDIIARLAGDVCLVLEQRGQGGRRFEVSFFRSDGAVRRIDVETGVPCRDVAVIRRLVRLKIEALADPVDPGFGFDSVRLGVLHVERLDRQQASLDGNAAGDVDVTALVDRLTVRFGRERVMRFVMRDVHEPSRAAAHAPALSEAASAPWPALEPGGPPTRPLTLFDPPQLVEAIAEVPDGPPLRFRWRRVLHEIARSEGPERIAPEWWLEGACAPDTRDYYRVEDAAGHRFWLFREGLYENGNARPRWFLHGLFA